MSEELQTYKPPSVIEKMAGKYSVDPTKLLSILGATAFKQSDGGAPTVDQMAALLVVADQYGLNPFTREIYAFADKRAGIVPVVGVDGWSRIINEHPASDGFEFRESENMAAPEYGKPCPEWMEVIIYRKDRGHPIIIREHINEVYRPPYMKDGRPIPGPWQTHTNRMFRHKTLIQGARVAYGFTGIFDEDEADRIIEMGSADVIQSGGGPSDDICNNVHEKSLLYLETKDAQKMQELWAPYGVEEFGPLWRMFNAPQRSAIQKLLRKQAANHKASPVTIEQREPGSDDELGEPT